MNPEIQYPEIKEMKNDEIFIEWAYIIRSKRNGGNLNLHTKTIIKKQSYRAFVKALEQEYKVEQEDVELVTISR
jgi:hypothetical protein